MKYPYQNLNPTEFEALCCDVFGIEEGVRVECFKPGKDQGIDGRAYDKDGKKIILQCKHYVVSGFKALIASLRKEVQKVEKLAPTRYIVFTSVQLSPENKNIILGLFRPYLCRTDDIWGATEIDAVLEGRQDILRKHHKLWMLCESVLSIVLNSATYGRSRYILDEIKEEIPKYVYTLDYERARSHLQEKKCLIITGAPGIGKTTLARMLCYSYVCEGGWNCFFVTNVKDAESVFVAEEKQVFCFDDFMGANFLEIQENKVDSEIVTFVKRVTKSTNKRFVLTTRTNIMNAAMMASQFFSDANIRENEYCMEITCLDVEDKAWILYNHIYHSDMEINRKNIFLAVKEESKNKTYWAIIRHPNFNPRIISYITCAKRHAYEQIDVNSFPRYIFDSLDTPQHVWRHCFETQISETCCLLVMMIFLNGGNCEEKLLRRAFDHLTERFSASNIRGSWSFNHCVEILIGALVNRNARGRDRRSGEEPSFSYTLFDPSIGDFLLANYMQLRFVYPVLLSLQTPASIVRIGELWEVHGNIAREELFKDILFRLFNDVVLPDHLVTDYAFLIIAILLKHDHGAVREKLCEYLAKIDLRSVEISRLEYFLDCFCVLKETSYNADFSIWSMESFIDFLLQYANDRKDVFTIHKSLKRINGDAFLFPKCFYVGLEKKYIDEMGSLASDYLSRDDFRPLEWDGSWNCSRAVRRLTRIIEDELSEYDIDPRLVDIDSCIDCFDMLEEARALSEVEDESDDWRDHRGPNRFDDTNEVHVLFEKGFEK